MNTNDFSPFDYNDVLFPGSVFELQYNLFIAFMRVEGVEWGSYCFDINCIEDQQLFKEFLQGRFVEELAEASASIPDRNHFLEEVVDAFNFLIEAFLLYGLNYRRLPDWVDITDAPLELSNHNISLIFYPIVERVGMTCNLLKNRKWKQSHYLVDLIIFEDRFISIWVLFNLMCNSFGISKSELYTVWSLKYQVNDFRINSRY